VSKLMVAQLTPSWKSGYPNPAQGPCVALQNLMLVNVACDNSQNVYFDYK
jgi:hypothetical protein